MVLGSDRQGSSLALFGVSGTAPVTLPNMSLYTILPQVIHPILSTAILPTCVLLIINIRIHAKIPLRLSSASHRQTRYQSLKSSKYEHMLIWNYFRLMKDIILTKMSCIIVTVFILCNLPRLAVGVFELTR